MVKKYISFLISFICIMFSSFSFAAENWFTQAQWQQFINSSNSLFGVTTSEFNLTPPNRSYALIYSYISPTDIRVYSYYGTGGVTVSRSSNTSVDTTITTSSGSFELYSYNGSTWKNNGSTTVKNAKSGNIVITDTVPIVSNYALFYTYSFATDNSTQINALEQTVTVVDNKITTLTSRVDSIDSELGGTSEKLDSLIQGQQTTNQQLGNISQNQQTTNQQLGNISQNQQTIIQGQQTTNQQLENLNNTLTEEPTTSEDDFADAFPEIEVEDITSQLFESLSTGILQVLTQNSSESITINFRGNSYVISSDMINPGSSGLISFVGLLVNFGLCIWLVKDIRHKIQQIQEGKIESIATEDISSNMV